MDKRGGQVKIIVYTQSGWHACTEEKAWLSQHHTEFEERNIRDNVSYIDEVIALGSQSTPTTIIENETGQHVIVGFQIRSLKNHLKL